MASVRRQQDHHEVAGLDLEQVIALEVTAGMKSHSDISNQLISGKLALLIGVGCGQ